MPNIIDRYASKVPEVTLGFWIIKIFATTLGEVGGNAVTLTLGLGYLVGTAIFSAALLVVLTAQIRAKRFHAFLYWAAITATTLTGTTLADFFDRSLGIGYLGGSLSLFTLVILTLGCLVLVIGFRLYRNRHLAQSRGVLLGDYHVLADSRNSARRLDGRYRARLPWERARDCGRVGHRGCLVLLHHGISHPAVLGRLRLDAPTRCYNRQFL